MGNKHCDQFINTEVTREEAISLVKEKFHSDENFQESLKNFKIDLYYKNTLATHDLSIATDNLMIYARTELIPFKCQAFLYFEEHMLIISIWAIITIVAIVKMFSWRAYRKNFEFSNVIYQEIIDELDVLENGACVKYFIEKLSTKYGENKILHHWPIIEQLRVKNQQILVFKDEYQGIYQIFWKK